MQRSVLLDLSREMLVSCGISPSVIHVHSDILQTLPLCLPLIFLSYLIWIYVLLMYFLRFSHRRLGYFHVACFFLPKYELYSWNLSSLSSGHTITSIAALIFIVAINFLSGYGIFIFYRAVTNTFAFPFLRHVPCHLKSWSKVRSQGLQPLDWLNIS